MERFVDYEKKKEKETILWQDRQRVFGLPVSFTRYQLTGNRLNVKSGFFNTKSDDVLLYRILDIEVRRSFGQKLFAVGTVIVYAADRSSSQIELKNIKKAELLASYMGEMVEQIRDRKRLVGRELYGVGRLMSSPDGGDFERDGISEAVDSVVDIESDTVSFKDYSERYQD